MKAESDSIADIGLLLREPEIQRILIPSEDAVNERIGRKLNPNHVREKKLRQDSPERDGEDRRSTATLEPGLGPSLPDSIAGHDLDDLLKIGIARIARIDRIDRIDRSLLIYFLVQEIMTMFKEKPVGDLSNLGKWFPYTTVPF